MLHPTYYDAIAALPRPDVRYVVSLSSGVSSAVAADRVIQRYGGDVVDLVFMDTRWEDEDNYRFLAECGQHWGQPIIRLLDGRTPLEVAEQEHIIPNQKIAPCTHRLKIDMFLKYLDMVQTIQRPDVVVVVLGMSWQEPHRMAAPRRHYAARGCMVDYPLMWTPYDYTPFDTVRSWGIEPPRMYRMGYTHANCGGRCVKQGKRDWLRTLTHFPDRFAEVEAWEQHMRRDARFRDYGLLRDQSGGEVSAYTLAELRASADTPQLSLFVEYEDDTTNCFCNAGDPGPLQKVA